MRDNKEISLSNNAIKWPFKGTIFLWMTQRSRNVIEAVYQVRAEAIIYRLHWLTRIVEVDWPLVTAGLKRRSWNTRVGMSKKRKKKWCKNKSTNESNQQFRVNVDREPTKSGENGHKTLELFSNQTKLLFLQKRYLWPLLYISCYLPICLSGSMATKHRCGNQARMVKRSLPVPADTLVWPCWAQTTRKSLNCVCCFFFHCLSGRNNHSGAACMAWISLAS